MHTHIDDLFDLSTLDSPDGKFENIDLNQIVDEVKTDLQEILTRKNATIQIKELCSAYIIPLQFRQLLTNVLRNALEFSKPATPPHIIIESKNIITSKVNAAHLIPGKEYCHISIRDNGIGFDPAIQTKIFGNWHVGTNTGLSVVRKIVENHHGFIFATSKTGHGATLDVYIPTDPLSQTLAN